jgi:hypothetical protein
MKGWDERREKRYQRQHTRSSSHAFQPMSAAFLPNG